MRGKCEHDEIGIETMQHMDEIGIVILLTPLMPDMRHNFMLSLSRYRGIAKDNGDIFPGLIGTNPLSNVEPNVFTEIQHKFRPRRNDIAIPGIFGGYKLMPGLRQGGPELLLQFLLIPRLLSRSEPSRPLLIHFSPGRYTINRQIEQFPWSHGSKEAIHVATDILVHFLLGGWLRPLLGMGAGVDDSVHVDVEVVAF